MFNMTNFKGGFLYPLIISSNLVESTKFNANEKILLAVISNNSIEGDGSWVGCKLSNEQLANMIGVKASKVETVLKSLKRKGAIHVEEQGNERVIFEKGDC